ncbi:MAP/microtubule affinity-regulating kinase 4 [Coelomomyces lativittatus]|nr:MAP/microtubule affinity-regulating kinase 4 [Coelomomyces lativittatus]
MSKPFSTPDPSHLQLLWIPNPLPLNTSITFPCNAQEDDFKSIADLLTLLPPNCSNWKITELLSSLLHLLCHETKPAEYGYSNMEVLAQGVAGKLRLAEHKLTGEKVVIKSFDTFSLTNLRMAVREILLNALLDHTNLSSLLEVTISETSVDLIFRYQPEGDLLDYLTLANHKGKRMNELIARSLFQQIVNALSWLHERGLVHRDIKPENILVDRNGRITIIDFGFTLLTLPLNTTPFKSHSFCGSLSYAAPEVLAKKPYCGHSTDIWSLGITLYVLTTGVLPFEAQNVSDMFTSMIHQRVKFPPYLSSELRSLLLRMLDPNPDRRATLHEIQHAAWLHPSAHGSLDRIMTTTTTTTTTTSTSTHSASVLHDGLKEKKDTHDDDHEDDDNDENPVPGGTFSSPSSSFSSSSSSSSTSVFLDTLVAEITDHHRWFTRAHMQEVFRTRQPSPGYATLQLMMHRHRATVASPTTTTTTMAMERHALSITSFLSIPHLDVENYEVEEEGVDNEHGEPSSLDDWGVGGGSLGSLKFGFPTHTTDMGSILEEEEEET